MEIDKLDMSSFNDNELLQELSSLTELEEIDEQSIETDEIDDNTNIDEFVSEELDETDETEQAEEVVDVSIEDTPSDTSPFSLLAVALVEEGVLPSLTKDKAKEFKSFSDIVASIQEEIKNNEFAGLTEAQKEYLKALEAGVSDEEFRALKQEQASIESITEDVLIDSENVELRKNIIVRDLLNQGVTKEKAEKLAQRSIDLGEDVEDAKEALETLKKHAKEQEELKIKQAQEQRKQKEEEYKKTVETLKTQLLEEKKYIIEGLPYSKQIAEKVFNSITKPVKVENGKPISRIMEERMKNPLDFEVKLNYIFEITDGFKNFDKIVKTSKSKAVDELGRVINANTFKGYGSTPTGDKGFDVLDKLFGSK